MSGKLVVEIWHCDHGDASTILVLMALADEANDKGEYSADINTIARKARQSPRNCRYILRKLEELQIIERFEAKGRTHTNSYCVHIENLQNLQKVQPLQVLENLQTVQPLPILQELKPAKGATIAGFSQPFPSDSPSPKRETQDPPIVPPTAQAASVQDGEGAASPGYSAIFEKFWQSYPNKKNKGDAWRKWKQMQLSNIADCIIASVIEHIRSYDWLKEGGRYIPHPATFLHRRGWEDVLTPQPQTAAQPTIIRRIAL